MPGDVGLVAALLSQIFGFLVDPNGLSKLRLEHQLGLIREGMKIALDNGDFSTADRLFQQLRELRAKADA